VKCECIDLGRMRYDEAYKAQRRYIAHVKAKREKEYLLFVEHENVFTLGRGADWNNLLVDKDQAQLSGIDIVETDRGGEITYHGPGQIVCYPILNMQAHYKDVHKYMFDLEEIVIRTLSKYGIASQRVDGRVGVWTETGKICSVGVGFTKWITYHGLALNANVDLKYFNMINPCGFKDINITSMKTILKKDIDTGKLKHSLMRNFSDLFNLEISQPIKENS